MSAGVSHALRPLVPRRRDAATAGCLVLALLLTAAPARPAAIA